MGELWVYNIFTCQGHADFRFLGESSHDTQPNSFVGRKPMSCNPLALAGSVNRTTWAFGV
jgi:hypothetical protein